MTAIESPVSGIRLSQICEPCIQKGLLSGGDVVKDVLIELWSQAETKNRRK